MNKVNKLRDDAQREIMFEAISAAKAKTGSINMLNPISLGFMHFWETMENITAVGVDSNGILFDKLNRIIRYRDLSLSSLFILHTIIVKQKAYVFTSEN